MKKWFLFCAVGTILLGCAWHFFYTWWPHPLVGLFAPVDESIWEHCKLLYWPVLPGAALLARRFGGKAVWSSFLCQMLWMPVFLVAFYYVAAGGFGVNSAAFNIVLYAVTVSLGYLRAWGLCQRGAAQRWLGELLMLVGLYGCALVLFSLAAPDLPIFQPPW